MATSSEIQVTEAYIGLLGRAPDPAGLAYWTAELDAAIAAGEDPAVALKKLTNDITLSDEWDSGIGANDGSTEAGSEAIVTSMYDNLFDRAASQAELDYWAPKIVSGEFTASEMAVALIEGAGDIDGQVLGYKQQAATYYVENVLQDSFSRESAGEAVVDVNGPISFQSSKEATDYVATGVGVTTTLSASDAAGMNVTVTSGSDTVIGTVGSDATYSTQNVIDDSEADSDTFTITGNAGFTFDNIEKVENVNVSLSDTLGGGFTIAGANNVLDSTINIDVADTVTVVGVELTGETVVSLTGALTSDVSTTDVTDLTAVAGSGAITITGDADLASLTVSNIDANDTNIVLSAASATVSLDGDGADTANDSAAVSATGAVALSASAGNLVTKLDLSGNGAAVNYTVTNAAATSEYTVSGDQDVTLTGAPGMFSTTDFTDSSTGSTTLVLNAAGATDLTNWGVLSGGITLGADLNNTLTAASGNTVKITAEQTNALTIDANDTANDSAITLDMDNDTVGITTEDVDVLTIDTGNAAVTITGSLDTSNNDADVTIAGTSSFTITDDLNSGDLTVAGLTAMTAEELDADGDLSITVSGAMSASDHLDVENDATISADSISLEQVTTAAGDVTLTSTGNDVTYSAAADVSGNLTVTAADDFAAVGTLSADNDITITADDFNATTTVDTLEGDLTITATNDVDINGALGVDGALTITQSATAQGEVDFAAAVDVDNDVNITSGTNVIAQSSVTVNAGSLSITSQNDIDLDGATAVTGGSITLTTQEAAGGDIDIRGVLVSASNDITITSADQVLIGDIGNTAGDVTITAGNEVTFGDGTGAFDVNLGSLSVTSSGAGAAGMVNIVDGGAVDNDITLSGDEVDIDGATSSAAGDITITAANDIDLDGGALTATTGSISMTSTGGNGADVAATEALSAQNDITVSADDVTLAAVTSTATGDVTITATNDVTLNGAVASTTTQGNISVTAGGAVTIAATMDLTAENDITVSATGGGVVTLNDSDITADAGDIILTGGQFASGTGTITATAGDITINSSNDSLTSTIATLTADGASSGGVTFVNGTFAVTAVNSNTGGITIAGDSSGSFGALAAENSGVYLTTSGNVTATTIDSDVVLGAGGGDYALGTVTSSAQTTVQITTGAGDDSMTLNAEEYTVSTGDGADTITVTDTDAGTVINTGDGDDTISLTAGASAGTYAMGGDTDTIDLSGGNGDYSGDAVWTDIEILTVAGGGTTTLSEAQLDNDGTFEIRGGNETIAVTGTSLDASGVTYLAGNTSSFNLTGTAAANTLIGSDAGDTLDGAGGADTLTGGLGGDTFVVNSGDTGITEATALTITDFLASTDTLDVDDATGTYAEADGAAQTFATFLTAAATSFAGGGSVDIYASYNMGGSGNTYVLIDEDGDGAVSAGDTLIILTGLDEAADLDGGDFG